MPGWMVVAGLEVVLKPAVQAPHELDRLQALQTSIRVWNLIVVVALIGKPHKKSVLILCVFVFLGGGLTPRTPRK